MCDSDVTAIFRSQYKLKAKGVLANFDTSHSGLSWYGFREALVSNSEFAFRPGDQQSRAPCLNTL
jgi:hypothetical protein